MAPGAGGGTPGTPHLWPPTAQMPMSLGRPQVCLLAVSLRTTCALPDLVQLVPLADCRAVPGEGLAPGVFIHLSIRCWRAVSDYLELVLEWLLGLFLRVCCELVSPEIPFSELQL